MLHRLDLVKKKPGRLQRGQPGIARVSLPVRWLHCWMRAMNKYRDEKITASEMADACVCEQRVLFDRQRGCRRSESQARAMAAGDAAHREMHRRALPDPLGDRRCFVASAVWGPDDGRTCTLRAWRDEWLLKWWWGRAATLAYYWASPAFVRLVRRSPVLARWATLALERLVGLLRGRGY